MALLRSAWSGLAALAAAAGSLAACSLVLDTKSLQSGSDDGGQPVCVPTGDACSQCLAKECCDTLTACLNDPDCSKALEELTRCTHDAGADSACGLTFLAHGHQPAVDVGTCSNKSCKAPCGL